MKLQPQEPWEPLASASSTTDAERNFPLTTAVEPTSSDSDVLDEKPGPTLQAKGAAKWAQRDVRIRYSILQNPGWAECMVLGFQVSDIKQLSAVPRCAACAAAMPKAVCLCSYLVCKGLSGDVMCVCCFAALPDHAGVNGERSWACCDGLLVVMHAQQVTERQRDLHCAPLKTTLSMSC